MQAVEAGDRVIEKEEQFNGLFVRAVLGVVNRRDQAFVIFGDILRTEVTHAVARAQLNDVFIPELELVDGFRERNASAQRFTWISRRSRFGRLDAARVDYALVHASLLPCVREAGILDEETWWASDHRPSWLDLRANEA